MATQTTLDPITFAVVRNGLISAAREMYGVFKRTTMLPVLYEYNDFGMSIYDDRLNLIAEAPGLPIFVGSLDDCIERTLEAIGGTENLQPGDILVNNHPYLTAGQPADAALIEPIFLDGKLIAFGALRAHMGDLAAKGPYPTNSTEVYQEGLILPALKLYDAGRLNEDRRVASPGSSAASRFSISASMRCSSIDSAMAPTSAFRALVGTL